jgi:hypothetical protein
MQRQTPGAYRKNQFLIALIPDHRQNLKLVREDGAVRTLSQCDPDAL